MNNDQLPEQPLLQVLVQNPESNIFKGNAVAVSSINAKGPFDILPLHTNFICMIKDSVTIYESQKKIKKIPLEQGILKVFENTVTIFLGIETVS
jgi:F0F1-type ATP synthase epsilon subunit